MTVPADLDPARLGALLDTDRLGRSLDVRATTGSTMDDARDAADRGVAEGHVVVADAQRAGRGARGHAWSSPAGTDLYLSLVWRPAARRDLPVLTLAVGLGVAEAVDALVDGAEADVDWPNDVRLRGRKCAGVLVESVGDPARGTASVIVGVGLDVNRVDFPDDLAGIATSLRAVAGHPIDRGVALATLLGGIERWLRRWESAGAAPVVEALRTRLAHLGERVRHDTLGEGIVRGVADDGALELEVAGRRHRVIAGRIHTG